MQSTLYVDPGAGGKLFPAGIGAREIRESWFKGFYGCNHGNWNFEDRRLRLGSLGTI
jgi:hypothetical protein